MEEFFLDCTRVERSDSCGWQEADVGQQVKSQNIIAPCILLGKT